MKNLATIVSLVCLLGAISLQVEAKTALLGKIKNNQQVVTEESDSVFTAWKTAAKRSSPSDGISGFYIGSKTLQAYLNGYDSSISTINQQLANVKVTEEDPVFVDWREVGPDLNKGINAGTNSVAKRYSVALGVPLVIEPNYAGYLGGNLESLLMWDAAGWSPEYIGETIAVDRSVAIGPAAKALPRVSVAIGNQAYVGPMHGPSGTNWVYVLTNMTVVTKRNSSGVVQSVTTNNISTTRHTVDTGMWERAPTPAGFHKVGAATVSTSGGITTETQRWQQDYTGLPDLGYVDDATMARYNREFWSGQGLAKWHLADYGIAIGSRAYVYGHHSMGIGHYAHVMRPQTTVVGSESWNYAENSTSIGFEADVGLEAHGATAIGSFIDVPAGHTNAVVVGGGRYGGFCWDNVQRAKSAGPNTMNLWCWGSGLDSVYLDGTKLTDRLYSEVKKVGNTSGRIDVRTSATANGDYSGVYINGKSLSDIIAAEVTKQLKAKGLIQ